MGQLVPFKGNYYLWSYMPSPAAAILFSTLFGIATALHAWKTYRTRAWFCSAFVMGGIFQTVGYAVRTLVPHARNSGSMSIFVPTNTLILLGPALFAASVYMTLGRIIAAARAENLAVLRVGIITTTFVVGDVFSFTIQGAAAGMMAVGGLVNIGEKMVIAGLVLQVVIFGIFVGTMVIFQRRMERTCGVGGVNIEEGLAMFEWRKSLRMLYGVSLLIMVRSVFRVVEYAMGRNGYLLKHEWTLYVFDSVLMLGAMIVFYIWFPGELPAKLEETEKEGL